MHPLRVLLLISLVIALAVAWGFGAALVHAGTAQASAVVLAIAAFGAFMLPWTGVLVWAVRRANDLDILTDRARAAAEAPGESRVADRRYHAELDDLARAIEELRSTIVRQRQAHEEHRAAMAEIVGSLGEGLLAIDPKGRVVVANPRVAEMFGAGGDLVGRSALEIVRKQSVVAAFDKALRGAASTERVTVGSESDERQIEVRVVPVAASAEIAAVALFIDVTTIERLQRVRKEFLDDFSHEVRTPLTGLKSAAETLDGGRLTREHELQLRQIMQRQIARIERLVTDLSELNQIESGQLKLERHPVNLRDVLSDLCDDFQERSEAVRFSLHGEETIVPIDALRAQQIFTNLLDNARKHGGGQGEVVVEVSREDGEAVVRVSDEGPGIPQHELDRVFHRFYRVDRSRSQPGTGLGLAIAKHLVALHGGTIRAYNRPAGGATFEVRLPFDLS
ncbi:MAG: two-component system, OmpR family, phosphate regulon sensor histidine kinase PhoR [Acidobacteriota bacterium]|jgi:two-component system phosphate regulon sensor histidine kinase PhoR|nr:two-component system, OmpR family, phosphate regulon sensor histidine kinase PhoR [Acidobacteriota bacterium]